ncbi:MAG: hypothetical protein EZS28_034033 [Streblomastix strix]|uniref:Uncharacterized protein n=1 Tax=Streblomastix strix TaxID=222440 RepID=A0A5J4UIF7_9EUKA|nr:MAG: hypothetical protein EZS28_034033 [Streblomastix strix]
MRNRTKTTDQLLRLVVGLERMNFKMIVLRRQELYFQLRRFICLIDRNPTQDQISNFFNKQAEFSESPNNRSISLLKINGLSSAKSFENKDWKEKMIRYMEILQVLYWWHGVIVRNQEMTLEVKISEAVMVQDASPKGWGVTLELQTGDTLVQHGEWNKEQKRWTSNKKEMEAIFLDLFRYGQVFKELQIKVILIKSDSSTAVQDLAKQRAGQTLAAEVKKIVRLCQQLRIQIQTQHIPGVSNKITDALSRQSTQGDYSVKKEIFRALCQAWEIIPTLDLFATGENKLVDRFVTIGEEEEGAEWLNAFSRPWKEEIFWIHQPIPKIGKAMIAWEKFKPKSIMIAPWWPGQIWFTSLLTDSSRYLILGESSLILNPGKEMIRKKDMLTPGKIAAFLMDQELIKGEEYQQNFQITQT